MTSTFRVFDIQKSVVVSMLLHAAVFLALALKITRQDVVPIGVEVQYFANSSPAAAAIAPQAKARVAKLVKAVENKEPRLAPATSQTATDEQANGPVGREDGVLTTAIERYKYELRLFLESRKIYPESAKRLHQTGTVIVEFKVKADGQLLDVSLSQASASETLNRAALDLVRRASIFKPFPKEVQMQELKLLLPVEYIL